MKTNISGFTFKLSVEHIDDLALNMPLLLYFQNIVLGVNHDMMFNVRVVKRYSETMYEFLLEDKLLRPYLESCLSQFKDENNKGLYKFYILRKPSDVPSHAIILKDRSFSYIWREIIANGLPSKETS